VDIGVNEEEMGKICAEKFINEIITGPGNQ
jgi:hypothetical protein